ncbi:MAG: TIGR02253 family HAD-type hydrolase [Methanobacteriaceae archaeon]|nr:TIGR02253 family HAD-type hydrolase [Methanobacteriaceae archaeon]
MINAVFFDMDDTLCDTSGFAHIARTAAIKAMVDNGLPCTEEEGYTLLKEIIKEKGSNYNKHFNILTKKLTGKEDPFLIVNGIITYHNTKFAMLRSDPVCFSTMIYLKTKGYKLALISNGVNIKQWEKLVRLNLYPFFDEVITSESVGYSKPDKKIFDIAMKRIGSTPETSIMIGNDFNTDIKGAYNSGMRAMLINSKLTSKQQEFIDNNEYKLTILSNLGELKDIL